jgi:adenylate cyclase
MYLLRTFGGLAIERDGVVQDPVGAYRKALALLTVLAVQGSVGRERLAALLWPESDANRAKGSLNQAIHLLRRHLDTPDLLLGTSELRLNPQHIDSDVSEFLRLLENANAEAAVDIYGGPFLDGVHLDGTPDFERWADSHRSELARRYVAALDELARAAEARDDAVDAARWWRQLQNAEPFSTRAALGLMRSLDAGGDRAGALRHARTHETLLREELGIAVDPEILALTERLRSSAAAERAPMTAPAPLTPAPIPVDAGVGADPPAWSVGGAAGTGRRSLPLRPVWLALVILLGLGSAVLGLLTWTHARTTSVSDGSPGADPRSTSLTPATEPNTIAVLPFADLSEERDQQYFSDGIAEELIAALSRIDGLRVVARSSAFQFRNSHSDVREIGQRLGARYVVEGSVRKAGDRLRVIAHLVSTDDGYQVWSETYERGLNDIFAIQEEISGGVVSALHARLGTEAQLEPGAPPTHDLVAYEAYLKGLHFLNRLQIAQAIDHLGHATRRDSQFARAHAALAEAYAVPAAYGELPHEAVRARGVAAARTALRLDPSLAEAHAALGWLELIGLRWEDAERALLRAIELDPRSPRARLYYSIYLHRRGELEDALIQLQRARAMDPLSLPINAMYGSFLGDAGRVDEAVEHLTATLELDPSFPIAHAMLGHIYMGVGRGDAAIRHYERVAQLVPTSIYQGFLGHAHGRIGRSSEARRILEDLKARESRDEFVSPGAVGWVLLGLGEREEGFRWMERAAEERDPIFIIYAVLTNEHLSAPFREDPRFQELRTRLGLQ